MFAAEREKNLNSNFQITGKVCVLFLTLPHTTCFGRLISLEIFQKIKRCVGSLRLSAIPLLSPFRGRRLRVYAPFLWVKNFAGLAATRPGGKLLTNALIAMVVVMVVDGGGLWKW
jgi:hypothetical protein